MSVETHRESDLRALAGLDVPRSTRELSDRLHLDLLNEWADEHGYGEIAWFTDEEPLAARLLASGWARDRGTPVLMPHDLYPVLRRLERAALVERIQIDGHRPLLWRRAEPTRHRSSS